MIAAGGAVLLIGANLAAALTATNTVPATRADDQTQAVDPNATKPAACSSITITNKISGSGTVNGTAAGDWMVGGALIDTMSGFGGGDCIEGLGSADIIDGGTGTDVCLGGAGIDTFLNCETQIQ